MLAIRTTSTDQNAMQPACIAIPIAGIIASDSGHTCTENNKCGIAKEEDVEVRFVREQIQAAREEKAVMCVY